MIPTSTTVSEMEYIRCSIRMAAVSLSGPRARITRTRLEVMGRMVRVTADELTRALGGVLPDWREQVASTHRGRRSRSAAAGESER